MTYRGHKNYQTWNVLFWIDNDEGIYNIAKSEANYDDFVKTMRELGNGAIAYETPDNVAWADPTIDRETITRIGFKILLKTRLDKCR
jgi:hypothetical protein